MIKKQVNVEFELSPMDLAIEFCEMDGEEQAEFFNSVAQLSRAWDKSFCFQLQAITDSKELSWGTPTGTRD